MTVSKYTGRDGRQLWRYSFTYTSGGRQRHAEQRKFATRREAVDAERQRRQDVAASDGQTIGNGTVGDFLRWWIVRYEESGARKQSTVVNARKHVDVYLLPRLDAVRLRKLRLDDVQRVANDLHARGAVDGSPLSPKTVSNAVGTLRKALADAVKWRILPYNVAVGVDLPRRVKYEGDAYDDAEIGVLLAYLARHDDPAVSTVDYALIRTLFATGLRRGELLGLRWRDVDLVERVLTVRSTRVVVAGTVVETDPKTVSGRRRIRFDGDTCDALARLRNEIESVYESGGATLTDDDYVALRHDGRPIHPLTFARRFQRHAQRAGLRVIRLHDTRGSHVQEAVARGVDVVTVSRRVGHSRTSTTLDLYGRVLPSHDHEAADRVGASLTDAQVRASTTDPTSSVLRTTDVGTRTKNDPKTESDPERNVDGTTKTVGTVEATSGIERRYEYTTDALY